MSRGKMGIQVKEYIRKIYGKDGSIFILNFLISLAVCILFVGNEHFSTDDYYYIYYAADAPKVVASSYRNSAALGYFVLNALHINWVESQTILGIFFIFILSWCITKIFIRINTAINKDENLAIAVLLDIGVVLLFENAFLSEWLWFAEAYIQWALAVLGVTLAALYIGNEYLTNVQWIFGSFWLFIAAGGYQPALAQYVYIVMLLIFINNNGKLNVKSIAHIFKAAISGCAAILGNIFLTKLLTNYNILYEGSRMSMCNLDMMKSLKDFFRAQKIIWVDGLSVAPKGILILTLILFLILLVLCAVLRKADVLEFVYVLVLLISGQCIIYASQIMQGFVWCAIRVILPSFGMYTVLITLICYYLVQNIDADKWILNITSVMAAGFLVINSWCVNNAALNTLKTNALDKEYMHSIAVKIQDYETENNIKVTKAGFCGDANIIGKYYNHLNDYPAYSECFEKAVFREWSDINALQFYTNQRFERVEVPEEIRNSFSQMNWNQMHLEQQIQFIDDCVYICVY